MNKYVDQFYKPLFSKIDLNQEQISVYQLMKQYHELLIHYTDLRRKKNKHVLFSLVNITN
jgi:hypothetical protein